MKHENLQHPILGTQSWTAVPTAQHALNEPAVAGDATILSTSGLQVQPVLRSLSAQLGLEDVRALQVHLVSVVAEAL